MIEVIYKDEKQEAKGDEGLFSIPRNIRQIGLVNENYRIYVEDYVYTFLGRLAEAGREPAEAGGRLAVLTGEVRWNEGAACYFIRGAVMVEDAEAAEDHIDFSEKVWGRIYEEQKKYFPGQEIVGWFFAQQQISMEVTEHFAKTHLRHFGGEKVLMLMNPAEKEEAFFRYENGFMTRQTGYYIFYEKNPLMQEYMIVKNQELKPEIPEAVGDEAVKTFRKIIMGKKKNGEREETEEHTSVFSYAATACLVLAVLAVGASFYRNYQNLREADVQTASASGSISGQAAGATPTGQSQPRTTEGEEASGGQAFLEKETANSQAAPDEESADEPESAGGESADEPESAGGESAGSLLSPGKDTAAGGLTAGESAGVLTSSGEETAGGLMAAEEGVTGNQSSSEKEAESSRTTTEDASDGPASSEKDATSGSLIGENEETAGSSDIYKEESDERKAKRREALAAQEEQDGAADVFAGQEGTADTMQGQESYVIQPGDTIYQISIDRYGSMEAISEICRLNGLAENQIIYPGQVIVLP